MKPGVLLLFVASSLAAQVLDRTKVPVPGPAPQLRVPAWTKGKLANGADFIVSEKHDLPLVSFSITFKRGANQVEPPNKRGLAGVTAAMMLEGTTTKDGKAVSNALQLLGTSDRRAGGIESLIPDRSSRIANPGSLIPNP